MKNLLYLPFALLLLAFWSCEQSRQRRSLGIILAPTQLIADPSLETASTIGLLRLDDTVVVLPKGILNESSGLRWRAVKHPRFGEGWVEEGQFRFSDELLERTTAPHATLPPPPRIPDQHDFFDGAPRPQEKAWSKLERFWTEMAGNDYERTLNALLDQYDPSALELRKVTEPLAAADRGPVNVGQVANLFDEITNSWQGINDPATRELYLSPIQTVVSRTGDCDDASLLLCALVTNIGGHAVLTLAHKSNGGAGHAFAEALIGLTPTSAMPARNYLQQRYNRQEIPGIRIDTAGYVWLNLDHLGDFPGDEYYAYDRGLRMDLNRQHYQKIRAFPAFRKE